MGTPALHSALFRSPNKIAHVYDVYNMLARYCFKKLAILPRIYREDSFERKAALKGLI